MRADAGTGPPHDAGPVIFARAVRMVCRVGDGLHLDSERETLACGKYNSDVSNRPRNGRLSATERFPSRYRCCCLRALRRLASIPAWDGSSH